MPTNQTSTLKLSQWEPDDEVLRTDFNADNAKIDAAVKNLQVQTAALAAPVLLLDVSLAQQTSLWRISLTGLDLSPFRELVLYPDFRVSTRSSVQLYLNNNKRNQSIVHSGTTASSLTSHLASIDVYGESSGAKKNICRMRFDLKLPRVVCEYIYSNFINDSNGGYFATSYLSADNDLSWSQVTELDFANATLNPGSRILIYGTR